MGQVKSEKGKASTIATGIVSASNSVTTAGTAVSYTHLDVQIRNSQEANAWLEQHPALKNLYKVDMGDSR